VNVATLTRDEAIRALLWPEAIDDAVIDGRCTYRCRVTVDPIVDGRTTIWHEDDGFPVVVDDASTRNREHRYRTIMAPYTRWTRQFHPAPEAWMT